MGKTVARDILGLALISFPGRIKSATAEFQR